MARAVRSLPTAKGVVLSMSSAAGRMTHHRPVAGRKCLVWTSLWLGPLLLLWGGFIVLSHQPGLVAITWGRWLFGWLVLLSYVMVCGPGSLRHSLPNKPVA
jgi:hypothetical protein